ncbi:MAG: hypothetical protein ABI779_01260 [Acidobacteriota bacterium]
MKEAAVPDQPSVNDQISSYLVSAQELKHRQRYFSAMSSFLQAEALIIGQLPPDLRDGTTEPRGPEPARFAPVARAFFRAGAELAIRAGASASLLASGGRTVLRQASSPAILDEGGTRTRSYLNPDAEAKLLESGELLTTSSSSSYRTAEHFDEVSAVVNHIASLHGTRSTVVPSFATRVNPTAIPAELGRFYFADIPLGMGDCLVQLGQQYDKALEYYNRAEHYPYVNPPFETPDLWLRLAEVHLALGDASYRSGNTDKARMNYEVIIKQGEVPSQSKLYQDSLAIMLAKVRFWLQKVAQDPAPLSPADFPPRHLALLATVTQRLAQLDASLDFFGRPPAWRPIFSFAYLREVARSFAQFAAQANREYVAYTQRAEDQTQTVRQMEQTVALGEASIRIDQAHLNEVRAEVDAAFGAEQLAETRATLMRDNLVSYATKGWDIVRLDAASAWAGAASVSDDDEIRLTYTGLENLGIGGTAQRSDLLQSLAWQRGTRSYRIELDRLRNAVAELEAGRTVARLQTALAQSRLPAAQAAVNTAKWRNHFARVNLMDARTRETSAELFFDLARLVRDTAQIYLERAIGVALAMEQAYNFENTAAVRRIRTDYGDLGGAGSLYAADFLLRDIDAFLYETIMATGSKSQLVIRFVSLRREYPLQYTEFIRTGRMVFQTTLDQFHGDAPGTYNGRIKRIALQFAGFTSTGGIVGSLTCGGVSAVRGQDGAMKQKVHQTETMVLSPLTPEKALARLDGIAPPVGENTVFENVGLQCSWVLEIPLRANDMQLSTTADVGLVVAYLCQHDPVLEANDRANMPATGTAEAWFSLRDQGRDSSGSPVWGQLQKNGESPFEFLNEWIPRNITRTAIESLSIVCVLRSGAPVPLAVRFWTSTLGDPGVTFRADQDGVTRIERVDAPGAFHQTPVPQSYRIAIDADSNPSLASSKPETKLDLSTVQDIVVVFAYEHGYR